MEGKDYTSVATFLLIWKRQPDGSYRAYADTYVYGSS